jgi:hypothetical protein
MSATMHCRFCRREMDLAQQFAYLVEVQTQSDPVMMAAIRRLPHSGGVPLRVCKGCQAGIEQRRFVVRDVNAGYRRGGQLLLLAAFAVGLGLVTAQMSQWLTPGR